MDGLLVEVPYSRHKKKNFFFTRAVVEMFILCGHIPFSSLEWMTKFVRTYFADKLVVSEIVDADPIIAGEDTRGQWWRCIFC